MAADRNAIYRRGYDYIRIETAENWATEVST